MKARVTVSSFFIRFSEIHWIPDFREYASSGMTQCGKNETHPEPRVCGVAPLSLERGAYKNTKKPGKFRVLLEHKKLFFVF